MAYCNCLHHLESFSKIDVMHVKLQIAVLRATLIFLKRFPVVVSK